MSACDLAFAYFVQGKEIDMSQKPDGIDYVIDAVRSSCKPVLILCKEYVGFNMSVYIHSYSILFENG